MFESEARRERQEFKRQMEIDAAEEMEDIKARLKAHERAAAAMPPPAPPRKDLKGLPIPEFLDELQRRHPWLVINRKRRTR